MLEWLHFVLGGCVIITIIIIIIIVIIITADKAAVDWLTSCGTQTHTTTTMN